MTWTTDKPTEPGLYLARIFTSQVLIVRLSGGAPLLQVAAHFDLEGSLDDASSVWIGQMLSDARVKWCRIPEPEGD